MKNAIKTKKLGKFEKAGIVLAKDWWPDHFMGIESLILLVDPNDYVVCSWVEYKEHSKKKEPRIGGKATIAICKNEDDAEIFSLQNDVFTAIMIAADEHDEIQYTRFRQLGPLTELSITKWIIRAKKRISTKSRQ